jgi:phosphonate transport system permease protein
MYDKIFPPKKVSLPNGKVVLEKRSRVPLILLTFAVATYLSVRFTEFDLKVIFSKQIYNFFDIINDMIPPNWHYFTYLWKALVATIQMSLLGSLIGAIIAVPFAVLASSNIMRSQVVVAVFKVILSLLRTLPTLVTASVATLIFGFGPTAGIVALLLFTVSYVGKLLYEAIENADMGSFEAMESIGMTRIQAFRYAIMPQVLPGFLSNSLYCFEGNIRYSAILGYVGAGGIGLLIKEGTGFRDYSSVGAIVLALVATVFLIETVSEHFRKKLI